MDWCKRHYSVADIRVMELHTSFCMYKSCFSSAFIHLRTSLWGCVSQYPYRSIIYLHIYITYNTAYISLSMGKSNIVADVARWEWCPMMWHDHVLRVWCQTIILVQDCGVSSTLELEMPQWCIDSLRQNDACESANWVIIGSQNSLLLIGRQAINWTNADI